VWEVAQVNFLVQTVAGIATNTPRNGPINAARIRRTSLSLSRTSTLLLLRVQSPSVPRAPEATTACRKHHGLRETARLAGSTASSQAPACPCPARQRCSCWAQRPSVPRAPEATTACTKHHCLQETARLAGSTASPAPLGHPPVPVLFRSLLLLGPMS
jgi:hypothetical protein